MLTEYYADSAINTVRQGIRELIYNVACMHCRLIGYNEGYLFLARQVYRQ